MSSVEGLHLSLQELLRSATCKNLLQIVQDIDVCPLVNPPPVDPSKPAEETSDMRSVQVRCQLIVREATQQHTWLRGTGAEGC